MRSLTTSLCSACVIITWLALATGCGKQAARDPQSQTGTTNATTSVDQEKLKAENQWLREQISKAESHGPAPQDKGQTWTELFDGKTLAGWRPDPDTGTWSVVDGVLVGKGDKGHLYSTTQFANFEFRADVKINRDGNSGFFFGVTGTRQGDWPNGPEVQIVGSAAKGDKEGVYYTGSLYRISRVVQNPMPDDTWFRLHIAVKDNHVTVTIDGTNVVDHTLTDPLPAKGWFALQVRDKRTNVTFRDIMVKSLD